MVPYSQEAEESVLGTCLVDGGILRTIADEIGLTSGDFFEPKARTTFAIILDLHRTGAAVDPITVADRLPTDWAKPFLAVLVQSVGVKSHAIAHAEMVKETSNRRDLIEVGEMLTDAGFDPRLAPADAWALARASVANSEQVSKSGAEFVRGGEFIFESTAEVAGPWGKGDEVAWASGEPLIVAGPQGVGKTTLLQNLVLARIGLNPGGLLGLPVAQTDRPVLYLAADRPRQAQRSIRRMVAEADRAFLDEMVLFWKGPPPVDLAANPDQFAAWVIASGAGEVYIDSLKDVATKLTADEVGAQVNRALQLVIASGVEVAVAHHQRKPQADNRKPSGLGDVYGSTWITAGAGSVLLLWGAPGDSFVELSHLKQPNGSVGPLNVFIDHATGGMSLAQGGDLLSYLHKSPSGAAAIDAAGFLFGGLPGRNEIERARRKLEALVDKGLAHRADGDAVRGAVTTAVRYFATIPEPS